jgi:hypothetical protein
MKFKIYKSKNLPALAMLIFAGLLMPAGKLVAQDSSAVASEASVKKVKPVKNTFQSIWIIDNQTVMVPVKGTFEMDIQHRFGSVKKGYQEMWGLFSSSNIRLGASYAPIEKLNIGIGVTRLTAVSANMPQPSTVNGPVWDGSLKYSLLTQTPGKSPVSVTYYGNMAYNTKQDTAHEIYINSSDRMTFFNQIIIARKINDKLSIQIAPSLSHQNVVNGYYTQKDSANLLVNPEMEFNHFAIAFSARYKLTSVTSLMINYDQPITKHTVHNPAPNLSFGLEFNTSSHSFQLFATNFYYLSPQANNMYNNNSPFAYKDVNGNQMQGGQFVIGFNITRLWNY